MGVRSSLPTLFLLGLLMAGCQSEPQLATTPDGDVYVVEEGELFHLEGSQARRVSFDWARPPQDSVKEFTDTIRGSDWAIRSNLKFKYFGASQVRYRLVLSAPEGSPGGTEMDCWREADPFLWVNLADADGFRITRVSLRDFGSLEGALHMSGIAINYPRLLGFPSPSDTAADPDSIEAEISRRADPFTEFVASEGRLTLSADDFERLAGSTAHRAFCR